MLYSPALFLVGGFFLVLSGVFSWVSLKTILINSEQNQEVTQPQTPQITDQAWSLPQEADDNSSQVQGEQTPVPSGLQEKTWQVQAGESWWKIAEQFYGTGYAYRDLAAYNAVSYATPLAVDTVIRVPLVLGNHVVISAQQVVIKNSAELLADDLEMATATQVLQEKIDTQLYVVKPGDSLWSIAQDLLKDGYAWVQIYQLNEDHLADPDLVVPEMILLVPASPLASGVQ